MREQFTAQARAQLEAEGVEGASVMAAQNVMETMSARNRELFKVPPYTWAEPLNSVSFPVGFYGLQIF